jgi:hypothetical protein
MVTIGSHTLIYVNESAVKTVPDMAKTVVMHQDRHEPSSGGQVAAVAEQPVNTRTRSGAIFILTGANSGKRIDLVKAVTNLGRAGHKAGTINRNPDGSYVLIAGNAEAVPKLNGLVVGAEGKELRNGDIIEVSGARMQFYLK